MEGFSFWRLRLGAGFPLYNGEDPAGLGGPPLVPLPKPARVMAIHFAVLGDGAWGTSIALVLAGNPAHHVALWSAREENGRIRRERRENVRLRPGVPIPAAIRLTTDIA